MRVPPRATGRPLKVLLAVAVSLLASGCLTGSQLPNPKGGDGFPLDASWADRALTFGEGHDHHDVAPHANLSTPNFQVLGHDPLISAQLGATIGGHFCGDAQATPDGRRLAAVEMRNVGGFALADVSDAQHPTWVGEFVMRYSRVYDLAVAPDGKHVLLVTTNRTTLPAAPNLLLPATAGDRLLWRTACPETPFVVPYAAGAAEDPLPRPSSLILVNIENPASPQIVDQRPIPTSGHSVFSTRIDGRTWVLVATTGNYNVPTVGNRSLGRYYQFYELLETPAGARLNLLSTYLASTPDPTLPNPPTVPDVRLSQGHDGWIAKHPGKGQVLAYLAGGTEFSILDLANPARPQLIATWTDWAPDRNAFTGALHSVYPVPELWGGRHYTVLGPEFHGHPGPLPSGVIWVLDTTDPTRPRAVGAWTLPHDVEWTGEYMFSTHYFTVVGRTAFVSMYHGGVWAVDLSPVGREGLQLLPSIGVFLPDRVSPKPPPATSRWAPTVEEVLSFSDGTIVTFDGPSGLYVLRFDASRPAPAPEPWPIPSPPNA